MEICVTVPQAHQVTKSSFSFSFLISETNDQWNPSLQWFILIAIGIRAKALFFGQKLNFSGRSQQPKMEKKNFLYLLNKKPEFSLSSERKCPKSGIFTNNYWVG